jgi:hydrogenase expression/formation protein HypC
VCLSVPARVVEVHDASWATVDIAGTTKRVSIDLVQDVQRDDWVLLHVGFALEKIDEAAARETLALFEEFAAGLAPEPEGWAEATSP